MNIQAMGKLCKANGALGMYYVGKRLFLTDNRTMMEVPQRFPALRDEREAAAVFGWTDKQLEMVVVDVAEEDAISFVHGIDMRDALADEEQCEQMRLGFMLDGRELLILKAGGTVGFVDVAQLAPVKDELARGQYLVFYRRFNKSGNPYYVLKDGMVLRLAVLPMVFTDDRMGTMLDEIRAGMVTHRLAEGEPE